MAANTQPIYSKAGAVQWATNLTTAANDFDGTGANNALAFTADATNGGMGVRLRIKAKGTNVASALRIFINNGSTNGTAANNTMFGEIPLPATTANAAGMTSADLDYTLGFALQAGQRIYVGLATTVAAGWQVTAIGGAF